MSGAHVNPKSALRARMREAIGTIGAAARVACARRAADLALRSPPFARAQLVLAYRALPDEIDADPLVRELLARGVRIAFPLVVDAGGVGAGAAKDARENAEREEIGREEIGREKPAHANPLRSLRLLAIEPRGGPSGEPGADDILAVHAPDALWRTDRFGIRAPNPDSARVRRVQPRDIDAVIVPGRAFDARGARLGRGKGFYDALLARLRPDARAATIGLAFETQVVERVPEDAHDARVAWIATDRRLRRAVDPERPAARARPSGEAEVGLDDAPREPAPRERA
jgi:5-formyltetrahydrofolate cyclo-ligase